MRLRSQEANNMRDQQSRRLNASVKFDMLAMILLLTLIPSIIAFVSPSSSMRIHSSQLRVIDDSDDSDSVFLLDADKGRSNETTFVADSKFGDVVPFRNGNDKTNPLSHNDPQFGDVVRLNKPTEESPALLTQEAMYTSSTSSTSSAIGTVAAATQVETRKRNNTIVALLSITLAFCNYFWQWTHPISAIQLLYTMEKSSAPITAIANNGKPTVVDFWAPWCENCKQMAPTLYQVEQEFSDSVNFIMVNGDAPEAWPLIDLFGVDAIPHLALVEADGTVDTALIGPVPKSWLEKDLQVMLENSKLQQNNRAALPYQMLDTFANRPEERRIQVQSVKQ
jgi:thiol-disulfide isomerase/thioredoxin